jgi:hypothetical protein
MLHIRNVQYRGGHRLWLQFSDGVEGEVDLGTSLEGPVFEALRDPQIFATARLDSEIHTVAWPNGADFAPEFLRDLLRSGVAAA